MHVDYFTSICLTPEEEPDYSSQILVANLNMHVVALDILKLSYVEVHDKGQYTAQN
jgi:hypothetical protein